MFGDVCSRLVAAFYWLSIGLKAMSVFGGKADAVTVNGRGS
jgi:hypothetical protein